MTVDHKHLAGRARRAYEMGRVYRTFRYTWVAVVMTIASIILCHEPLLSTALGLTLFTLATSLIWLGGTSEQAAVTGLKIGFVAFALPLLSFYSQIYRLVDLHVAMALINVGSGLLIGIVLGLRSVRLESDRNRYLLLGAAVAVLSGLLGCMLFGTFGIVGITVGMLVATMPVLAYHYAHA